MRLSQSIILLLLPLKAMACGLDWSEPVSHFENVDYQGNVHIVRKLGEMEKLPIYLIFNSSYGNSPYAGSGFEIPILESRMWQVDENRFLMKTPSGWLWIFQRTKEPNVLEGNSGWKGLINNDIITVCAPCGDKISFKNGKIISMQLKDEKFDYAYKGNRVKSIQMNGRAILDVKSDDKTGECIGIEIPGTRNYIAFQQNESRPMVETVRGISVVSRTDKTLAEVTKSDGSKETFEFTVDAKMNPTLKLNERIIVWSHASKKVLRDGAWAYQTTSGEDIFANAAIGRSDDASGKKEFWHFDGSKGREVLQERDGTQIITSWFTSGKLVGALRKREKIVHGKSKTLYQASYDENGNLFREVNEKGEVNQFAYDDHGKLKEKTIQKGGKVAGSIEYSEGHISVIRSSDGGSKQFYYDNEGREVKMMINGAIHSETTYAPDNSWKKVVVLDEKTQLPARTFFLELDGKGRTVKERITEHSGEYPEIFKAFSYDNNGRLDKQVNSQYGTIIYSDSFDGTRVSSLLQQ